MSLIAKLRFLPITIFVACLLLTVKIGDIMDGLNAPIGVADATAQAEPDAPQEAVEDPVAVEEPAQEQVETPAADQALDAEPEVSRLITDDPTLLTPAEIDLLQRLAERRREIAAREREITARLALLDAAEARIDRKILELQNLQARYQQTLDELTAIREQEQEDVTKVYENMKPKDAARIFNDLDIFELVNIAKDMNPRRLSPIMAKMDPDRARELTVELRSIAEEPADQAALPQ